MAIGLLILNCVAVAQNVNRALEIALSPEKLGVYDSLFNANDWRKQLSNKDSIYGKRWLEKMLKVGDKLPDIELGTVLNNKNGIKRFSDLKGKIVILDFWSTSCGACIAGFPKMVRLQEKFGGRIQIILVNTNEGKGEIEKRMGYNINKIPNLPSIVNAKHLFPYFPRRWSPYHVWIDQSGIIRIVGSSANTYEKKISDLLNGKQIFSWKDECTRPGFSENTPYYKLVNGNIETESYNSFFTVFNNDYAPKGKTLGSSVINKVDILNNTSRNTFINWTILELFHEAFKEQKVLSSTKSKYIFNPFYRGMLEVKDSLRYSNSYGREIVDTAYVKSMFCYEQNYPLHISADSAQGMMAEDLNTYFGKLYGTYGRMEKRSLPCYVIVKSSGKNYNRLLSRSEDYKETRLMKNGKNFIKYQAISFTDIFDYNLRKKLDTSKTMLINESGIKGDTKIDIDLPVNASLTDIKQVLRAYGLDIIERNTEVELLVISDTKAK